MASEKNIKEINRKYLIGYVLANVALFALFSGAFSIDLTQLEGLFKKLTSPAHLLGVLVIPLSLILEGLLSSETKSKLIFCRLDNPLPGCRAFTEIAKHDPRIDLRKVEGLFPSGIPKEPRDQNSVWYGWYKKHSSKNTVFEAHRAFLLTRDIAALTAILIPASLVADLIWKMDSVGTLIHIGTLILILAISIVASQNYGKRFVANVIVEEISR